MSQVEFDLNTLAPVAAMTVAPPAGALSLAALRRVMVIAGGEVRLMWRSQAFWLVTLIVSVFSGFGAVARYPTETAMDALGTALFFGSVVLPILFARVFARDRLRRVTPLIAARPVTPVEYTLGKWLGMTVIGAVEFAIMLVLPYVGTTITQGAPPDVTAWAAMAPIALVTLLVILSVTFLCLAALPRGFLGALAASAVLIYVAEMSGPFTLLRVTNLDLASLYYQPSVGFGPDTALALASQWAHLAVVPLCLMLGLLATQARQWRVAPRRALWLNLGGVVVAGALLAAALANFAAQRGTVAAPGPSPVGTLDATVSDYALTVTVDPSAGTIAGDASFRLAPSGSATAPHLALLLNPGLRLSAPQVAGQPVPLTQLSSAGWWELDLLGLDFGGDGSLVSVRFAGTLAIPRDDYAEQQPGLSFFGASSASTGPGSIHAYVGNGLAFLESGGDWYPRPWVNAQPAQMERGEPIATLTARVPAGDVAISSVGTAVRAGGWQIFTSAPNGPLPPAFLVAADHLNRVTLGGAPVLFHGGVAGSFVADLYRQQMDALRRVVDLVGGGRVGATTGVVLPLLDAPVVGPGLAFLPDLETRDFSNPYLRMWSDSGLTDYIVQSRQSRFGPTVTSNQFLTVAGVRYLLTQQMALAWWRARLDDEPLDVQGPLCENIPGAWEPQAPQGRLLCNRNEDLLPTILAEYTADTVVTNILGTGWHDAMLADRRAFQIAIAQNVKSHGQSHDTAQQNAIQVAQSRMASAGFLLEGENQDGFQAVLGLHDLAAQIGDARTLALLRDFAMASAGQPVNEAAFETNLSAASHINVATLIEHYVNSSITVAPVKP